MLERLYGVEKNADGELLRRKGLSIPGNSNNKCSFVIALLLSLVAHKVPSSGCVKTVG